MRREQIANYYGGSEICFGQFGTTVLTNSAVEPMVQGTTCISLFLDNKDTDVPFYKINPPIFNCNEPDLIARYMYKLLSDKKY